mmetsp:Transcript_129542/g.307320  ORF Transcript_129542/g.307320 Transcript_129542/m.307320 type:complete len:210 (+) Transcript_129542:2-631(+)
MLPRPVNIGTLTDKLLQCCKIALLCRGVELLVLLPRQLESWVPNMKGQSIFTGEAHKRAVCHHDHSIRRISEAQLPHLRRADHGFFSNDYAASNFALEGKRLGGGALRIHDLESKHIAARTVCKNNPAIGIRSQSQIAASIRRERAILMQEELIVDKVLTGAKHHWTACLDHHADVLDVPYDAIFQDFISQSRRSAGEADEAVEVFQIA